MSSCLILQGDNKLYIGADTSSSTFANGKLYRLDNKTKKIFKLNDNSILYCAGNNYISNIVKNYIVSVYNTKNFSFISLQKWLSENFPLRKNDEYTVYDVEILIATIKLDKTIIYQMSQYNNFVLVIHEAPKRGIKILSAGIKNQDCVSFAENEMLKKKDVKSIYYNTFSNLSCNYIGGNLDLYALSKDGVDTIFNNQRINEFGIQYICNSIKDKSVSVNAEVLISKLVMSENLWIENDSGTYKFNDAGFIASSGKNSIMIQPNNDSELFSIYKGNQKQVYINSDGDVEFAGILKSSSGIFGGLISGGSINLGNGTFTVDSNGNMYASSARISGEVNASSGTIGGWNINYNSLSSSNNSVFLSSDGTISGAIITGANGEFTEGFKVDLSDGYDFYQKLNFADKGFYVSITTTETGNPKVSSVEMKPDGTIWISANGGNHIDNGGGKIILDGTPYTKNQRDERIRLARVDQIPSRTTDIIVSYRGTSSDIINFSGVTNDNANYAAATPQWVKNHLTNNIKSYTDSYYAPISHKHSSYQTASDVRSIVRSMVKSSSLK